MFHFELNNFLVKFHQLWQAGQPAHLNVDCRDGYAWCGLRVQLGPAPGHQQDRRVRRGRGRPNRSPGYHRRLERRKAARAAAEEHSSSSPPAAAQAPVPSPGPAAEAEADNDEPPAPAQPSAEEAEENESEIPKWFSDCISPKNKIHGNVKLVVSDQVDKVITQSNGERISYSLFVRKFWKHFSKRWLISDSRHVEHCGTGSEGKYVFPCLDFIHAQEGQYEDFEFKNIFIKLADLGAAMKRHVFFNSSHTSIYSPEIKISGGRGASFRNSFPNGTPF